MGGGVRFPHPLLPISFHDHYHDENGHSCFSPLSLFISLHTYVHFQMKDVVVYAHCYLAVHFEEVTNLIFMSKKPSLFISMNRKHSGFKLALYNSPSSSETNVMQSCKIVSIFEHFGIPL